MRLVLLLLAAVACVSAAPLGQPSADDAGTVVGARSTSADTDKEFKDMTTEERLEYVKDMRIKALHEKGSQEEFRASEAENERGFLARLKKAHEEEESREGDSS